MSVRFWERPDGRVRLGHSELPSEWKDSLRRERDARNGAWFEAAVRDALDDGAPDALACPDCGSTDCDGARAAWLCTAWDSWDDPALWDHPHGTCGSCGEALNAQGVCIWRAAWRAGQMDAMWQERHGA